MNQITIKTKGTCGCEIEITESYYPGELFKTIDKIKIGIKRLDSLEIEKEDLKD